MTEVKDVKILSEIDHVIFRPNIYVGSISIEKQLFWLPSDTKMVQKELDFIPGLFKIFNEILDNCVDIHIKETCSEVWVEIDTESNTFSIRDNGPGISPEKHPTGKHLPELLFTTLRSGSNFNDITGGDRKSIGMNGLGAALTNIFSSTFTVQIERDDKVYIQTYKNNNKDIGEPQIIKKKTKQSGTKITFVPDAKIFKKKLNPILIKKRCLELAYMFPTLTINLSVDLEKETYTGKHFEEFVKMFGNEYQIIDEKKDGFRLALVKGDGEAFTQYSMVNGADTHKAGSHIDFIKTCFVDKFKDMLWKTYKLEASSNDIAKHLHIIAFLKINAPMFDGQTKERLTTDIKEMEVIIGEYLTPRKVTSMCNEMPKLLEQIYESLMSKNEANEIRDLKKAQKEIKFKKVPKLIDCSSKDRIKCTIYLTEGDSAVAGLSAVRDTKLQAGLPLRGKVLNVSDMTPAEIIKNVEIQTLMSVLGLEIGKNPIRISRGKPELDGLRYGNISILTDADHDGSSIRCLLINFFYRFWPQLFEHGIITISEAPLFRVKDKKTKVSQFFYEKSEFNEYIKTHNTDNCEISYFKGLGSCDREGWDFFINKKKKIYPVEVDDSAKGLLKLAFGESSDDRKDWLR
jgi:DNA topoisomerase-2